jgi:hypothetical protein
MVRSRQISINLQKTSIFPPYGATALSEPWSAVYRNFTITFIGHSTRGKSFGRVINLKQRPLLENTQHSQDFHAPGGI